MTVKRVLIAEDSAVFADVMCEMLADAPGFDVVGVAADGAQAVRMTAELRPDVVTMDVLMPVMNGLTAIEEIMATHPTPILVLSGDPRGRAGQLTFEALRRGALDVMPKPDRWPAAVAEQAALIERIRFLSTVPVIRHLQARRHRWRIDEASTRAIPTVVDVVGFVASTGGPRALSEILGKLGPDFPLPIVVVQHLASGFSRGLCTWLDQVCALHVCEAVHGSALRPGTVHVGPPDHHFTIDDARRVRLTRGTPVDGHLPSGTVLLRSLAQVYGERALGVVLTGMGRDGAAGLAELHRAGAPTIAQDAATSVVDGMPRAARELGVARYVRGLAEVAPTIRQITRSRGAR